MLTGRPAVGLGADPNHDHAGGAGLLHGLALLRLPQLVGGLGPSHAHLDDDHEMLLSNAFGADKRSWPAVSPAHFDPQAIAERVRDGKAPNLVVLEQSAEDQLVPMSQRELVKANLDRDADLRVIEGERLIGRHAPAWEQGLFSGTAFVTSWTSFSSASEAATWAFCSAASPTGSGWPGRGERRTQARLSGDALAATVPSRVSAPASDVPGAAVQPAEARGFSQRPSAAGLRWP